MINTHVIMVHILAQADRGVSNLSVSCQLYIIHIIYAPIIPNNAPDAPTEIERVEHRHDSNVAP